jgi:hypothetical protein
MAHRSGARSIPRNDRKRRKRSFRIDRLWPSAAARRRWLRAFQGAPAAVQIAIALAVAFMAWLAVKWTYQVVRKPSELFFPVSGALYKTPAETWQTYAPIFRTHATSVITPDFLAALAQVEGSGNPVVRTYWRWSWTSQPFEIYRPASSAVGMYQITDGTFVEARRYCIHDHVVVREGPWYKLRSCWFNSLYTRVVPAHATELTSAYLDHRVASTLKKRRIRLASLAQKQNLAAVIHLCGATAGDRYAARGFHLVSGQRCGAHDVRGYLGNVKAMRGVFRRLAAA